MVEFNLQAKSIEKKFEKRKSLFSNISISLKNEKAIAITGKNGSGKSTLLKIIAGLLSATSGDIQFEFNNKIIASDRFNEYFGFVSPYLNLYEEFTAFEHIKLHSDLKGVEINEDRALDLLDRFNLSNTNDKFVSKFSSGMKQRLKMILALYNEPPILFLDEPFSNLDESGINIVTEVINEQKSKGGAVIIATNDEREKTLCDEIISLN